MIHHPSRFNPAKPAAMIPQTVHVLKPDFLDSGHAEDAVLIAQKTSGPLTYNLVDYQFDDEPKPLDHKCRSLSVYRHSHYSSKASTKLLNLNDALSISGPGALREVLDEDARDRMKRREPLKPPHIHESLHDWMLRLRRVETRYRFENNLPEKDFVILLSTRGNLQDFFAIPGLNGTRMAGIQINHAVMTHVPSHILVGYYLLALPIMMLAYDDLDFDGYRAIHAHQEARGCLNDLCDENFNLLQLKTKTGDICMDCKKHFQAKNLNWDLVRQMRQGFELIRAIQLHLEDFIEGFSLPALTVGMKPSFDDLGLTVPLSPKEMAVYVTFLEAGPEGIGLNSLSEHRAQLRAAYTRVHNRSDFYEIDRVVNRLIDPLEPDLQQVITKINRKFTLVLGNERSQAYLISGHRGGAKSIQLSRNLIRRA